MMRMLGSLTLVLGAIPSVATAQAYSCSVTGAEVRLRPDLPSPGQPRRVVPIGSYTLAITWSPQFCRRGGDRASAKFQCGDRNRFGFTLHGLWPDGEGREWPQYCRSTPLLSPQVVRANLCSTPSPQLMQHEWSKHGTCMAGYSPARYFTQSTALYRRLRYPDMDSLSRRSLTARGLAAAMARSNPGLGTDMMRITADKQGWLDEIWICLDRKFSYTQCPAHQGGLPGSATLKIWRGVR